MRIIMAVMEIGFPANDGKAEGSFAAVWELDGPEYECDCPGPPPPAFDIPPPPRPPFLAQLSDCDEFTVDHETCDVTVIDAGYHASPAFPTLTVLVASTSLLLLGMLIVFAFAWKHKKKVQNFIPCKSSPQNQCDLNRGAGVIYEDINTIRTRTRRHHHTSGAPCIEMIDIKNNHNSYVISHSPVFICSANNRSESQYGPPPRHEQPRYCTADLYNPVYEELSNDSLGRDSDAESESVRQLTRSDDEFAEDELSAGERRARSARDSDAEDRCRFLRRPVAQPHLSLPAGRRPRQTKRGQNSLPDHKRPKGAEKKRGSWRPRAEPPTPDDSLLYEPYYHHHLYPSMSQRLPFVVSIPGPPGQPSTLVNPYESVPVLDQLRHHSQQQQYYAPHDTFGTFRAPPQNGKTSQDSDSGYSNNTSGGRGSNSSRSRSDTMQNTPHSEYPLPS